MLRWHASVFLLLSAVSSVIHAEVAPKAILESELVDFGTVRSTDSPTKSITIENGGDEPLPLTHAVSACGCTDAAIAPVTLKNGEKATLKITLDLVDYPSNIVHSRVSVYAKDSKNPVTQFTVKAAVEPEFRTDPATLDFGRVKRNLKPSASLQFQQVYGPPVILKKIESPPELEVTFATEKSAQHDGIGTIKVALSPGAQGAVNTKFTIVTDSPRIPRLEVPVTAERVGIETTIKPKVLVFGPNAPGDNVGSIVVDSTEPFEITSVTCPDAALDFSTPTGPAKSQTIGVKAAASASAGKKAGRIRMELKQGSLSETREVAYYGTVGSDSP